MKGKTPKFAGDTKLQHIANVAEDVNRLQEDVGWLNGQTNVEI